MNEVQIRTASLPERMRVHRALLTLNRADMMMVGDTTIFELALKGALRLHMPSDCRVEIRRHRFRGECLLQWGPAGDPFWVRFMGVASPQGELTVTKMFLPD